MRLWLEALAGGSGFRLWLQALAGAIWEAWLAGLATGGIWRVLAVKSVATLSYNQLFRSKVVKSLQFLKVTSSLTDSQQ